MAEKLKILFLGEPTSANTINWTEGLRQFGCDVLIASARSDGSDGASPIGSVKLPARMRMLTGLNDVNRLIKEFQPDVLLGYRITSYGYLASRTHFHPLVLGAQNEQITYMDRPSVWRKAVLTRCAKLAIANADLIHAWGHNIKSGLLKFGADEKKIMVLHRGINTDRFNSAGVSRDLEYDSPVFISTRSLTHEYLIDILIKAFTLLLRSLPKAQLVIIGDGPDKRNLEDLATEMDVADQVHFKGRIPLDQVAEELKQADFYISLIQTEGISSSLVEACACGITPIVADIPASRELVKQRENGLLLEQIDHEYIADVMRDAVLDSALRQRAFDHAEIIRQNYNRQINLGKFIDAYRDLLSL